MMSIAIPEVADSVQIEKDVAAILHWLVLLQSNKQRAEILRRINRFACERCGKISEPGCYACDHGCCRYA